MMNAPHREVLDAELVPLSVAATVAYFHLADAHSQIARADTLPRAVMIAALALSRAAALHLRTAGDATRELSAREVEALLAQPIRQRADCPDLDRFLIRRGELHRALLTLSAADLQAKM